MDEVSDSFRSPSPRFPACSRAVPEGSSGPCLAPDRFRGRLRRSELSASSCTDIERVRQGLVITLSGSKTDQEGVGRRSASPLAARNGARSPLSNAGSKRRASKTALYSGGSIATDGFPRSGCRARLSASLSKSGSPPQGTILSASRAIACVRGSPRAPPKRGSPYGASVSRQAMLPTRC